MDPPLPQPSILQRLISADAAVSLRLHSAVQPYLPRSLLRFLEISGDGRLFFPIAISLLISPHLRPLLSGLLIGGVLDLIFVGLTKHLVRRPRPVYNKDMFLTFAVDHWSFPSGHSSRVCFIASFLYFSSTALIEAIMQLRSARVEFVCSFFDFFSLDDSQAADLAVLIICLWAAATSFSRVLLGRHFVCDVIAGACFGLLEALIVFRYINYPLLESYLLHLKM